MASIFDDPAITPSSTDLDTLAEGIATVQQGHAAVVDALKQTAIEGMSPLAQTADSITRAVSTAVNRQVGLLKRSVNAIGAQIGQTVDTAMSELSGAAAHVQAQAPTLPPSAVPRPGSSVPGYPHGRVPGSYPPPPSPAPPTLPPPPGQGMIVWQGFVNCSQGTGDVCSYDDAACRSNMAAAGYIPASPVWTVQAADYGTAYRLFQSALSTVLPTTCPAGTPLPPPPPTPAPQPGSTPPQTGIPPFRLPPVSQPGAGGPTLSHTQPSLPPSPPSSPLRGSTPGPGGDFRVWYYPQVEGGGVAGRYCYSGDGYADPPQSQPAPWDLLPGQTLLPNLPYLYAAYPSRSAFIDNPYPVNVADPTSVMPCIPTAPTPPIPSPQPPPPPPPPTEPPSPVPGSPPTCIPICGISPSPAAVCPPCSSPTAPSPPASIPASLTPPSLPTITIPAWTGGPALSVPMPGSPDWCAGLQSLLSQIGQIGTSLADWLTSTSASISAWGERLSSTAWVSSVNPLQWTDNVVVLVQRVMGYAISAAAGVIDSLTSTIRSLYSSVLPAGQTVYGGLLLAQAVWHTLCHADLGANEWLLWRGELSIHSEYIDNTFRYLINTVAPAEAPSASDAIECLLKNTIPQSMYDCWMGMNGRMASTFEPYVYSRREQLHPVEIIEWIRRQDIDDLSAWLLQQGMTEIPGSIDAIWRAASLIFLRNLGYIDSADSNRVVDIYDELPTISDHLHWLQRNVDDAEYVQQYNLLDGFADQATIQALGYPEYAVNPIYAGTRNFWATFGGDLRAQGMKQRYAAWHYAAHWIIPPLGQLMEMTRRLRPGRVDASLQFTETDLYRLMAEQDIAPWFRARLRAITYAPFGLRFLTQFATTGVSTHDDLVNRFQDIGYSAADAELAVQSQEIQAKRTNVTRTQGKTPANLHKLYTAGKITAQTVRMALLDQHYPPQVIEDAIEVWTALEARAARAEGEREARTASRRVTMLALDTGLLTAAQASEQLQATGIAAQYADSIAASAIATHQARDVQTAVKLLRKSAMGGKITLAQAAVQLSALGIVPDMVQSTTRLWSIELQAGKRQISARQIVSAVCAGELDAETARIRLANLQYADPDALILIAEAQQCIDRREALAARAQARADATAQRETQRLAAQAAAQADRLRRQSARIIPLGTLKTWLRKGIITAANFTARLTDMEIPLADIHMYLSEYGYGTEGSSNGTVTP